jgi:cell division transport system permease protein
LVFSVILKDNVNEAEIIRLQKSLDAAHFVRSTEYIPIEKAAKELADELGEDFIAFLGYNPLPVSIDVKLVADYANNDSIAVIEKDLQTFDQVKEVYYQKSLVHLVNENVKRISMIILLFSGLLFLVAIALVNNTIRLSVYSKRFIINTMQLVGATHSFIRKPFLFRSAMHGAYASLLAVALLMLTIYWIQKQLSGVISLRDHDIVGVLFVMVLVLGVILNWIATFFAR